MKKQATMLAVGALVTLVMTAPSFAEGYRHAAHHDRANAADTNSNYYNSTVGSPGTFGYGLDSSAVGGIGR